MIRTSEVFPQRFVGDEIAGTGVISNASMLCGHFTHAANRRLARHLQRYQDALFIFLQRRDVEATNWPAEHAIRPAVVNRKCGAL